MLVKEVKVFGHVYAQGELWIVVDVLPRAIIGDGEFRGLVTKRILNSSHIVDEQSVAVYEKPYILCISGDLAYAEDGQGRRIYIKNE